jgi:hypothetical protein
MRQRAVPDTDELTDTETHTALGLPDRRVKGLLLAPRSALRFVRDQKDQNNQYDRIVSNISSILYNANVEKVKRFHYAERKGTYADQF